MQTSNADFIQSMVNDNAAVQDSMLIARDYVF